MRRSPSVRAVRAVRAVHALGAVALAGLAFVALPSSAATPRKPVTVPLFPLNGVPANWTARNWNDVAQPASPTTRWMVRDGVLLGSEPRGTWLVSEQDYGDFVLEFEFRLPPRGNGGVAFHFPPAGDPSTEGFELQLVDPRYYATNAAPAATELTGSIYKAVAPSKPEYKPDDWNRCRLSCQGPKLEVQINGRTVQSLNLDQQTSAPERGKPLAQRPRHGRIGFQEISRAGGQIQIRNARITVAAD